MSRWMSSVACLVLIVAGAWWIGRSSHAAQPEAKPRFVLNLTSGMNDLHRTTMALALANHAADDGREVVIFLNVKAPELAKKEISAEAFGTHPSPGKMLAALIARGVQVHVCPMCMKAMAVQPEGMMSGVVVTDREKLFAKLTADAVVFSY